MDKTYLGDGVYVERNHARQVVLTTEVDGTVTNVIYLEPEVAAELVSFIRGVKLTEGL